MILSRIRNLYRKIFCFSFKIYQRSRLKNKSLTLIAQDCTGGWLLHELGLRFNTPTINLYFQAGDFLKFCGDLKYYLSQNMIEDKESSIKMGFPVGILGEAGREVCVLFMHSKNFTEAKAKWSERSRRVQWDNLYFIMTDNKGCPEEILREFEALPHKHKAFLTCRDLRNVKSAVRLHPVKLSEQHGLGAPEVFAFKSRYSFKRVIDDWDYVSFFNSQG